MKNCLIIFVLLFTCYATHAQFSTDSSAVTHKLMTGSPKYLSLRVLPSNYYSCNMGFFCKKEWQVEKAIKIPVRFRLGSVSYCDAMEGKK